MHITPLQAIFMENFKNLTSLFFAFTKGEGVDIVPRTHSRSRKVIRIANFNLISIIVKRQNVRSGGALWDTILSWKMRRNIARKNKRGRTISIEG